MHLMHLLTPPLDGSVTDLLLPLYIALVVLVVRVCSEQLLLGPLTRILKPTSSFSNDPNKLRKQAYNVFNNTFIAVSAALMTAWAWQVTLTGNGGCTPVHTEPCLADWPNIPMTMQFRLVWLTIFGFYLYEMIGTALRVGCVLSSEMVVHHVITMWMMLYGYYYHLHRYGLMATALLDTSNTLLHGAKAFHYAALPSLSVLQDITSKLFAVTFFVCRVLLPPYSLIKPGLLDGRAMPLTSYYITNGLLLFIYSLQLFWFRKIVLIVLGKATDDDQEEGTAASSGAHAPAASATVHSSRAKAE
eukprot:gene13306-13435_t